MAQASPQVKRIDITKDVFISYPHKADDFVIGLTNVFVTNGITFWRDKEDIYGSENWWVSIKRGIEQGSVFVVVLDEHYLRSKVCNAELTYACSLGKRILPVFEQDMLNAQVHEFDPLKNEYRAASPWRFDQETNIEVDQRQNWQVMSSANGVNLSSPANWDANIAQVIAGIRRDPEFLKLHREILQSAIEWRDGKKRAEILWRGPKLQQAVQWLNEGKGAEAELTNAQVDTRFITLQRDFIIASQQFVLRRRVTLLTIGAVVASLLLVATIIAWFERGVAETQRNIAETQRNEAIDQRNAAQRALQNSALSNLIQRLPIGAEVSKPLLVHQSLWVTYHNADGSGSLLQLDPASGSPLSPPIALGRDPGTPFSDGHSIWVLMKGDGTAIRVDPADPSKAVLFPLGLKPTSAAVCGQLFWAADDQQIVWMDTSASVSTSTKPRTLGNIIQPLVTVAGGAFVWVVTDNPARLFQFSCISPDAAPQIISINGDTMMPSFGFGSLWLTDRTQNELLEIDPTSAVIKSRTPLGTGLGEPHIAGTYLWLIAQSRHDILKIDPATKSITPLGLSDDVGQFYVVGDMLWSIGNRAGITAYDLRTGQWLPSLPIFGDFSEPISDGIQLWFTSRIDGSVLAIDLKSGKLLRTLRICASPSAPVFDGGNIWVACPNSGTLMRIPALLSYYELGSVGNTARPFPPIFDGQNVWTVQQTTGSVVQIEPQTGRILTQLSLPTGQIVDEPYYDSRSRSLWIIDEAHQKLLRIDVDNPVPEAIRQIDLIGTDFHLKAFNNLLWLAGSNTNDNGPDLIVINPGSNTVVASYDVGIAALTPTYDPTQQDPAVWFTGIAGVTSIVYRIDPSGRSVLSKTPVGAVANSPTLVGDSAWVVSIFGQIKDSSQIKALFTNGTHGQLYQLRRSDGQLLGNGIELDQFPRAPLIAGGHLWITQSALGVSVTADNGNNDNKRGILALDLNTGQPVASWDLCPNVSDPYFDGTLVWFVCLNLTTSDQNTNVLAIRADNLQVVKQYHGLGRSAWPATQIENTVWVVYQDTGNVAVFQAGTGDLLANIAVGRQPSPVVADNQGFVWIANQDDSTIQRINLHAVEQQKF